MRHAARRAIVATAALVFAHGPIQATPIVHDSSGAYNTLRLRDASPVEGVGRDGFDVAALSITSDTELPPVRVPEPAALVLLGAGLVGLLTARRRRRGA